MFDYMLMAEKKDIDAEANDIEYYNNKGEV